MRINRSAPLSLLITAAILTGCGGSTQLTNVWSDPQYGGEPIKNFLIVGVSDRPAVRLSFEDHFVSELQHEGLEAVSSAAVLGTGQIDSTRIHEYVVQNNVDAILVTRLLGVDQEQQYTAGTTYWTPSYYGGFYGYYSYGYSAYTTPGYWSEYEVVRLETIVYYRDAQILWAANSEAFNPGSENEVVKGLSDAVIRDLDKRGLLAF